MLLIAFTETDFDAAVSQKAAKKLSNYANNN